jgi:hypothetical protein
MEIFGIVLSFPASFIFATIYAFVVGKIVTKWKMVSAPLLWISAVVLSLVLLEIIGVITVGILKLCETLGPIYYPTHSLLFFGTLPSTVNIMRIQRKIPILSRWYLIGGVCAMIGLGIVVLQYGVSEALYGVNGTEGPYSQP